MREPRPAPVPYAEPDDAWSQAWGAPALQDLGRYLVASGSPAETATLIVEQIWLLYSYQVLPEIGRHVPMAIAASTRDGQRRIALLVLDEYPVIEWPGEESDRFSQLEAQAREMFAKPLTGIVDLTLQVMLLPGPVTRKRIWTGPMLDSLRRGSFQQSDWEFLGVYLDDLRAELATIMDASEIAPWLETPNVIFAGQAPKDILGTSEEQLLRDVVTRAKFNLPAA